jgi:hypothetical protein
MTIQTGQCAVCGVGRVQWDDEYPDEGCEPVDHVAVSLGAEVDRLREVLKTVGIDLKAAASMHGTASLRAASDLVAETLANRAATTGAIQERPGA